ncbi:MAG: peptide-N-glycosidase F-related protein [Bacteroidetes bacterium]|nr:peptide-N-glycosidase F-related protein [Bacteroidota bacterium]
MKNKFLSLKLILLIIIFLSVIRVFAGPGDTTLIQTFTYGSPQDHKFLFPDSTNRWSKILMYYTLKCNPNQSPACGEWDYLTYTFLYKHTGKYDSTRYTHPNYTWNGTTPDSLMYMNTPSLKYHPYFEYFNQTVPSNTVKLGDSNQISHQIFFGEGKDSRSQILWKADELSSAGLVAGQLTGIRVKVAVAGTGIKKLVIRMKQTALNSLTSQLWEREGLTEVYSRDFIFPGAGWQTVPFTYPFNWDGVSNIIMDISYEKRITDNENGIYADSLHPGCVIVSDKKDSLLNFNGYDLVALPAAAFSSIDSAITVAFWQYGDPLKQPENSSIFEGADSAGRRIVNVHLPWGNSQIYWDAGSDSSGLDRINMAANDPSVYRGKWNHWAFTKDIRTGMMIIYHNGQLWYLGRNKIKSMSGIRQFNIGSFANGKEAYYDGMVDEFSVWNKALSDTAISEIMYADITPENPENPHLVAYYQFNDGYGFHCSDSSGSPHDARLIGYPEWQDYKGKSRFRNMQPSALRPTIVFEEGTYNPASLDSIFKVDTLVQSPIMMVLYGDTIHPYNPTDTLTAYPAYYHNYVYDNHGIATDSTLVTPDGIMHRKDYTYYGTPYEVLIRYELARYITPYGINLSLGTGFTWIYDVTDYASLLHDSVHLSAGNWQELLDLKFLMIEGIPPRDVLGISNIYTGNHGYATADQHSLPPVTVKIDQNVGSARLKMRITGHGFGGNLDCSEFCPRTNKLFINGSLAYNHYIWRADCPSNPVFPQGGTWLYPRAEWCPGAEVRTKDFELTPFITPGDSLTIDYDLQEGYTWNGQGSWPYYAIESQLITYSHPNFTLDASIEDIVAPNNRDYFNRFNPVCGNPIIWIKNNGTTTITSADLTYGPVGGNMQTYPWTGTLTFMDSTTVTLPPVNWSDWVGGDNRFVFTISHPNGGEDQYSYNNSMTTNFDIPPTYDNLIILNLKTNHEGYAESWSLTDQNGNMIYHGDSLQNNTEYFDTLQLPKGCYKLTIINKEGEGLQYWANMPPYGNGTAGWAEFRKITGETVKSFKPDFGLSIAQSFTVGMTIDIPDLNPAGYVNVFPNPSDGRINLAIVLDHTQNVLVSISDLTGKEIYSRGLKNVLNNKFVIDLSGQTTGIYLLRLISENGIISKNLLIR